MATDAPPRWSGRLTAWLLFVLAVVTLGYAGQVAGNQAPDDLAYRYSAAIASVIQFGFFLAIVLLIARGLSWRDAFALRRPPSWPRAIGLVAASWVAILILSAALFPLLDATEEQGLVPDKWDSSRAGAFLAFAVAVTFIGPVVEELIFRGLGFTLLAGYGNRVAIVSTGFLFGIWHGLLIALPVLTAFGILLGWLRARTGSLYPCILLHAIFNGIAVASVPVLG